MKVVLYRVGRNLNRAYRTCEAFGVERMAFLECDAKLSGNLFKAQGRVKVENLKRIPARGRYLALETHFGMSIEAVDWARVDCIVLGGETAGLPRAWQAREMQCACIPMCGEISGLTVEASLAIALWEWRRNVKT